MEHNNIKKNVVYPGGFSLVEMMIAILIFSITMLAVTGLFANLYKTQNAAKKTQRSVEAGRNTIELMAKNLRMSKKVGVSGGSVLYMYNNSQKKCIKYAYSSSDKKISYSECSPPNLVNQNNPQCDQAACNGDSYSSPAVVLSGVDDVSYNLVSTSVSSPLVIGKAVISLTTNETHLETAVSFRDYAEVMP